MKGSGNSYTTFFRQYDPRIARWKSIDPVKAAWESPYVAFRNSPIILNDPNGDCPDCDDGKYEVKEGDNFWDLENKWNMEHGTLSELNKDLSPKELKIGQEIKVTYGKEDLPDGVTLNSEKSLDGMDGFFPKNAKGVNNIKYVSQDEFEGLVKDKALTYLASGISNMVNFPNNRTV